MKIKANDLNINKYTSLRANDETDTFKKIPLNSIKKGTYKIIKNRKDNNE